MMTTINADAVFKSILRHHERQITYTQRHGRIMQRLLDELDELFNLLVANWVLLAEAEILAEFVGSGRRMITLASEEAEMIQVISRSNLQSIKELMEAVE